MILRDGGISCAGRRARRELVDGLDARVPFKLAAVVGEVVKRLFRAAPDLRAVADWTAPANLEALLADMIN